MRPPRRTPDDDNKTRDVTLLSSLDAQVVAHRARLEDAAAQQEVRQQAHLERLEREVVDVAARATTERHLHHQLTIAQQKLARARGQLEGVRRRDDVHAFEAMVVTLYDRLNRNRERAAAVVEEFWTSVRGEAPALKPTAREECTTCHVGLQITQDAQLGCPVCGVAVTYLDATSFSMAYGDEVEFQQYQYKREGHFKDNLSFFQAKQSTHIALDTLKAILQRVVLDNNIRHRADIDVHMIRPALKKLDLEQRDADSKSSSYYRRLYDHYMLIYTILSGKPAPRLTFEQECNILMLFQAIQPLFEKHCPPDRKNFMNYNYCTYKFCQRLGLNDLLPYFPLLKCSDKLRKQDEIMKKIFADLKWPWIPTMRAEEDRKRSADPERKEGERKRSKRMCNTIIMDLL